jgi:hypothetical protein
MDFSFYDASYEGTPLGSPERVESEWICMAQERASPEGPATQQWLSRERPGGVLNLHSSGERAWGTMILVALTSR